MDKAGVLNDLIGRPYDAKRFNCWHCAGLVLERVYGIALPKFAARDNLSRETRVAAMERYEGWDGWQQVDGPRDGAIMLMGRAHCLQDMHAGVWIDLGPQSGCIHCDDLTKAVSFDDMIHLAARGFTAIRFFIPR